MEIHLWHARRQLFPVGFAGPKNNFAHTALNHIPKCSRGFAAVARQPTGSTHPVVYAISSAAHLSNAARCAVYGATDADSPRRQIRAVCWRARGVDQRQNNATRHGGPKKKSVACEMFICEAGISTRSLRRARLVPSPFSQLPFPSVLRCPASCHFVHLPVIRSVQCTSANRVTCSVDSPPLL